MLLSPTRQPLPVSFASYDADVEVELPFAHEIAQRSLTIQTRRAMMIQNAIVASQCKLLSSSTSCSLSPLFIIVVKCSAEIILERYKQKLEAPFTDIEAARTRDAGSTKETDLSLSLLRQSLSREAYTDIFLSYFVPEMQNSEASRPLEKVFYRIFDTFKQANRNTGQELLIAILVLLQGSAESKLSVALQILEMTEDNRHDYSAGYVSVEQLKWALRSFLLSIIAIFEQEDVDSVSVLSTDDVVCSCINGTVEHIFRAVAFDEPKAHFEKLRAWFADSGNNSIVCWYKFTDLSFWPRTKRQIDRSNTARDLSSSIVDSSSIQIDEEENGENAEFRLRAMGDSAKNAQSNLTFVFSGIDGGRLVIDETAAEILNDIVSCTQWLTIPSSVMYDVFDQHTGDGLLQKDSFLESLDELLTMTNASALMGDEGFRYTMLEIFACFSTRVREQADAIEVAAGFSLFTSGGKSDKLASAFYYFDVEEKGYLDRRQLWLYLRSVLVILLFLSPPSEATIARYGSLIDMVDTGEQEIIENITEGIQDEIERAREKKARALDSELGIEQPVFTSGRWGEFFTFEHFGLWYNVGGFKAISWLELLDLRKWTFVSRSFQMQSNTAKPLSGIKSQPSGSNVQSTKDAGDQGNVIATQFRKKHTFSSEIMHQESRGTAKSAADPSSNTTSLPAIVLKHDIILEFELLPEAETSPNDKVMPKIQVPVSSLCFDNGDIVNYSEFQRVTKLYTIELHRMLEVFKPFLGHPEGASLAVGPVRMEKDTFDVCMQELLPNAVNKGVAQARSENAINELYNPTSSESADHKALAGLFSRFFFAFNREGTGKIDLKEFLAAFSLFLAGSKSEKLAFAFRLFDTNHDGCLTRRELWKYLRSFLTLLLVLGSGADLSAAAIANMVDAAAIYTTNAIFKDSSTKQNPVISAAKQNKFAAPEEQKRTPRNNDKILHVAESPNFAVSFDAFAQWYSKQGYKQIAWIELLDTKKWPVVEPKIRAAILKFNHRQYCANRFATQQASRSFSVDSERSASLSGSQGIPTDIIDDYVKNPRGSTATDHTYSSQPNSGDTDLDGQEALSYRDVVKKVSDDIGDKNLTDVSSPPSNFAFKETKMDFQSIALQFRLCNHDNTFLRIRLKDVAVIFTISERMKFMEVSCLTVSEALQTHAHGRIISEDGFLQSMRELMPGGTLTTDDQEFLSFHLIRLYMTFKTTAIADNKTVQGSAHSSVISTSSASIAHLVAALGIFCGSSKNAKLSVLFRLYDFRGQGFVHRRHIFELLQSILAALLSFSTYASKSNPQSEPELMNAWSMLPMASQAAGELVSKIFIETKCMMPDHISLPEFATWYSDGGYVDCPWLELLDLSKWPIKQAFEAVKQEKPSNYSFDIREDNNLLQFSKSDITCYLSMIHVTDLNKISPGKIYDAIMAYATVLQGTSIEGDGNAYDNRHGNPWLDNNDCAQEQEILVLSRQNFYECIRSLVPNDNMSERSQQLASKLLSRIYNSFDRGYRGQVNALELACGLSILGKGSKSQKLALAFEFIAKMRLHRRFRLPAASNKAKVAENFEGMAAESMPQQVDATYLPHSALFLYLRSFLISLMALSDLRYRLGLERMYVEANDFIEEVLNDILSDDNAACKSKLESSTLGNDASKSRNRVTFKHFGEWYNDGGYHLISWVELLDISKWEQQATKSISTSPAARKSTAREATSDTRAIQKTEKITKDVEAPEPLNTSQQKICSRVWVRQSDIALEPFEAEEARTGRGLTTSTSWKSNGPILVYVVAPSAGELHFFNEDVARLQLFLRETRLHQVPTPDLMSSLYQELHCETQQNSRMSYKTFIAAAQISCSRNAKKSFVSKSSISLSEEAMDLLYMLCEAFVDYSGPSSKISDADDIDNGSYKRYLRADLAVCGLLLLSDGTLLEKLCCCASVLAKIRAGKPLIGEASSTDTMTRLQILQDSLKAFLIALYGISCSLGAEVVEYSAQLGAEDTVRAYFKKMNDDECSSSTQSETKVEDEQYEKVNWNTIISLQEFDEWFQDFGYKSHSWLELIELRKWPALSSLSVKS